MDRLNKGPEYTRRRRQRCIAALSGAILSLTGCTLIADPSDHEPTPSAASEGPSGSGIDTVPDIEIEQATLEKLEHSARAALASDIAALQDFGLEKYSVESGDVLYQAVTGEDADGGVYVGSYYAVKKKVDGQNALFVETGEMYVPSDDGTENAPAAYKQATGPETVVSDRKKHYVMVPTAGHVLPEGTSPKAVAAALQEGTLQVILVAKTMDTNPDLQIVVSTDPFVIAAVDASGETDGKALGVKENDPRYAKKMIALAKFVAGSMLFAPK